MNKKFKLHLFLLLAPVVSGCSAGGNQAAQQSLKGMWLAPECANSSAEDSIHVQGRDALFGDREESVCLSTKGNWLEVGPTVRFYPRKSGRNDLIFSCDKGQASLFLHANEGKRTFLIVGGKAIGSAYAASSLANEPCTFHLSPDLLEAVEVCEGLAIKLEQDAQQCTTPCQADGGELICGVLKEGG